MKIDEIEESRSENTNNFEEKQTIKKDRVIIYLSENLPAVIVHCLCMTRCRTNQEMNGNDRRTVVTNTRIDYFTIIL